MSYSIKTRFVLILNSQPLQFNQNQSLHHMISDQPNPLIPQNLTNTAPEPIPNIQTNGKFNLQLI